MMMVWEEGGRGGTAAAAGMIIIDVVRSSSLSLTPFSHRVENSISNSNYIRYFICFYQD